jgi:hypothetical protein
VEETGFGRGNSEYERCIYGLEKELSLIKLLAWREKQRIKNRFSDTSSTTQSK